MSKKFNNFLKVFLFTLTFTFFIPLNAKASLNNNEGTLPINSPGNLSLYEMPSVNSFKIAEIKKMKK